MEKSGQTAMKQLLCCHVFFLQQSNSRQTSTERNKDREMDANYARFLM